MRVESENMFLNPHRHLAIRDPRKVIVLCLDIDQTLLDTRNSIDTNCYYFNGGSLENDAEFWRELLEDLKRDCITARFEFFVHIITAKYQATVDYTISAVVYHLSDFLEIEANNYLCGLHLAFLHKLPHVFDGRRLLRYDAIQSLGMVEDNILVKQRYTNLFYSNSIKSRVLPLNVNDYLAIPKIHLPWYNQRHNTLGITTSKGLVMQWIAAKYNIPKFYWGNLILVDDDPGYCRDASERGFNVISSENMTSGANPYNFDFEKNALVRAEIMRVVRDRINA